MNQNTQQDLGKLILRLVLGALILLHGVAKLKGGMGGIVGMSKRKDCPALSAMPC